MYQMVKGGNYRMPLISFSNIENERWRITLSLHIHGDGDVHSLFRDLVHLVRLQLRLPLSTADIDIFSYPAIS